MAFNKLSDAEAERLALLSEEAGEVIQMIGKILRHGYESVRPDGGESNRENLMKELGDFQYAVDLMSFHDDLTGDTILDYAEQKAKKFPKYQHHQLGKMDIY